MSEMNLKERTEIYKNDLFKWTRRFPTDLLLKMDSIAPIMKTLGYDTTQIATPTNSIYSNLPTD